MEFYWYIFIGVMLFLAGFVDSIAGGGGLISLPAYLVAGLPAHAAIATNKLSSSFGTVAAAWRYIRKKKVVLKCAIPAAIGALIGSPIGARLALLTDERVLKIILVVILPIIASVILFKKNFGEQERQTKMAAWAYAAASFAVGFFMGGYDGFFGPGTGTFLILLFTALLGQDLIHASGNTKIVNLTSNVAALITFLMSGAVWITLGLVGAVFNFLGNWLGSGLAIKRGPKVVKPVFVVVLALLLVRVLFQ